MATNADMMYGNNPSSNTAPGEMKMEDMYAAMAAFSQLLNQQQNGQQRMPLAYSNVVGQAALANNIMAPAGPPVGAGLPPLGMVMTPALRNGRG